MEVSMVRMPQSRMRTMTEAASRELGWFCSSNQIFPKQKKVTFDLSKRWRSAGVRLTVKAANSSSSLSEKISADTFTTKTSTTGNVKLFVGLPLDAVSDCNNLNHARAITAGLKALKLLGVEGVELPIWWGVVEKDTMGKYEWSSYLSLAQMVRDAGLKLRVSLCFHASKQPKIPLPTWVSRIGGAQPSIFFTDRSGRQYKDCLSLAVDDLPVLDGKTPLQVYQEFSQGFKSTFSDLLGSTIMEVSVSLGPDGELRYPSYPSMGSGRTEIPVLGLGEFQCYDEHMMKNLRQHAEATGNPKWGLGGPHDAPTYDERPSSNNFFRENGGSWETPYGDFFLSWYSNQLISHGDRILSMAFNTFFDSPVTISGKVPLLHYWYKTRSHPLEVMAGFYNTVSRDGYDAVAEMFARNFCRMVLPGMDLSEKHQPDGSKSSPELLLAQMRAACKQQRVLMVSGENSASETPEGLEQIKKNLSTEDEGFVVLDSFTYQRMGAHFFSPEHFPKFTEFARSLQEQELHSDDMEGDDGNSVSLPMDSKSGKDLQVMQATA
ncbi:inactive beta-amylase 9 [Macadamia integrifolia]|uniref:inactive beta-amylase 9 n=1 Tax=Macadamia integrifolia TaxID=60698 RepID=UPI001C52BB3F|nr:inactive beta-amylase 9 [Macadamia integrifolia]